MKTEIVPMGAVKANPNNPRIIQDGKFDKLVESIREFPEMLKLRPIVVNADGVVLGGNMRLKACKKAGLKEIPVLHADSLTEAQQREFIIKDNVGFGEWDWELIAQDWDAEQLEGWGLDIPDFPEPEPEAAEDDFDEAPPEQPLTVLGDFYEIGPHRLLCGDCTDTDQVARLMGVEKADLLITDLPYGVSYAGKNDFLNTFDKGKRNQNPIEGDHVSPEELFQFCKNVYTSLLTIVNSVSSFYAFMPQGGEQMMMMMALKESGFKVKHELIWVKNNHVLGRSDYNYKHEPICYGWAESGTHKFYGGFQTSVLEFDKPTSSKVHPTKKPVALVSKLVTNSSLKGGVVADPTLGSGSTMVAAHQTGRKCYGLEIDPKYCDVIIRRMLKLDPNLAVKRNGELTNDFN